VKKQSAFCSAAIAGSFFYYGLMQAHADGNDEWTIGVPRHVHDAFVCLNKEAAETIAKMTHQMSVEDVMHNPTYTMYTEGGICAWVDGKVEPLSVGYHDVMKDDARLTIKVVAATATPEKPDQRRHFISSSPIRWSAAGSSRRSGSNHSCPA